MYPIVLYVLTIASGGKNTFFACRLDGAASQWAVVNATIVYSIRATARLS